MKTNKPEDAKIIVQKIPCDMGIHRNARKGTLDAPEKLLESFSFGEKVLVDEVFPDEFSLEKTQERIEKNTSELSGYGKPLLSLGGDHSVSFPVIKSLKEKYPGLQLVWLDSHADLKEKIDGHVSHDVVVRELLEGGFSGEEIWIVGITRLDEDEKRFLEENEINIYRADEIQDFMREFDKSEQPVYLSLDIDVLDEELAPGTGYPDGNLEPGEVKKIVEKVSPDHCDIVEVAPSLDRKKNTVESAKEILGFLSSNLLE